LEKKKAGGPALLKIEEKNRSLKKLLLSSKRKKGMHFWHRRRVEKSTRESKAAETSSDFSGEKGERHGDSVLQKKSRRDQNRSRLSSGKKRHTLL